MRLFLLVLAILGISYLLLPSIPILAAESVIDKSIYCTDSARNDQGQLPAICDPDAINTDQTATDNILVGPDGMVTEVTQVLIYISGTLAAILVIIAGFMFIFSSGNPESTGRARNTMIYAVVGMIVAVTGQLIVSFVLVRL